MPEDEVAKVGERAVCAVCKPVFLQRVLQGETDALTPLDVGGRVMGFWETVGAGWSVIRRDWPALFAVKLLVVLPSEYLLLKLPAVDAETLAGVARSFRREQLAESLIGVFATLAVAWMVRERVEGRHVSMWRALGHAVRRWPMAVLTGWLEAIIIVFTLLLLIVPGLIYAGFYTFSTVIVSLRGRAGMDALNYSKRLVKGRWWRVFGYALGFMAPTIVVAIAAGFANEFVPVYPGSVLVENAAISFSVLFSTVWLTVFFLNLDAEGAAEPGSARLSSPSASGDRG